MESLSLGPRAEVTEMLLGNVCSLNLPKIPFSGAELRPDAGIPEGSVKLVTLLHETLFL